MHLLRAALVCLPAPLDPNWLHIQIGHFLGPLTGCQKFSSTATLINVAFAFAFAFAFALTFARSHIRSLSLPITLASARSRFLALNFRDNHFCSLWLSLAFASCSSLKMAIINHPRRKCIFPLLERSDEHLN